MQITEQQTPSMTVRPTAVPELKLEATPEQPAGETAPEPSEPAVENMNEALTVQPQTIAAGNGHSLILGNNGTVFAAGRGSHGQLGNGTRGTNSAIPVQVKDAAGTGNLTGVAAVEAGFLFSLALKNDGTVWTWGSATGFMTNSGDSHSDLPVQVIADSSQPLTGIVEISAKREHWLALKNDGTVWAWGRNQYGQLGNNTRDSAAAPMQVRGLDGAGYLVGITQIEAGDGYSAAVGAGGTIYTWGHNYMYQLGDGTQQSRNAPVPLMHPTGADWLLGVEEVSCGNSVTLVRIGGAFYTWGTNTYGEFGNGTSGNMSAAPTAAFEVPVGPAAGEAALEVSTGQEYTITATAQGITTQSSNFELTYDSLKLELADFAVQWFETVMEPGVYGNLTVLSVEPGRIVFYINTMIPDGLTWSGLVSKIKFTAVEDGTASVTLRTRQGGA